jgi:hypothetical protein
MDAPRKRLSQPQEPDRFPQPPRRNFLRPELERRKQATYLRDRRECPSGFPGLPNQGLPNREAHVHDLALQEVSP